MRCTCAFLSVQDIFQEVVFQLCFKYYLPSHLASGKGAQKSICIFSNLSENMCKNTQRQHTQLLLVDLRWQCVSNTQHISRQQLQFSYSTLTPERRSTGKGMHVTAHTDVKWDPSMGLELLLKISATGLSALECKSSLLQSIGGVIKVLHQRCRYRLNFIQGIFHHLSNTSFQSKTMAGNTLNYVSLRGM